MPLSQYKSQVLCCGERLRVIVFDKFAILSFERALNCTNTLCFDEVSKYFVWCDHWLLQVASHFFHVLIVVHRVHCSDKHELPFSFETPFLLGSIHFWLLNELHLHFRCGRWPRWSHPATVQCLAMQGQRGYLLNVLELLGNPGSVWKSQGSINIGTFSWVLLL